MKQLRGTVLLLLAALIWGTTFVAQSEGMNYVGPFTYVASRSYVGFAALLVFICFRDLVSKKNTYEKTTVKDKKNLALGALCCGVCLMIASSFQQIGVIYTTVAKAGFVTTMYILLVPIFSMIFGKKTNLKLWISVFMAVVGLYLLCINEGFTIEAGDIFVFISAIFFAIHIMVIDYFTEFVDGVKMACGQFLVCAVISTVVAFMTETVSWQAIVDAAWTILYAGLLSSGVAYTLQIVAQKDLNPTVASLIMSLESVISAISGWLWLNEYLSFKEMLGCIIMFTAVILAQLPDKTANNL